MTKTAKKEEITKETTQDCKHTCHNQREIEMLLSAMDMVLKRLEIVERIVGTLKPTSLEQSHQLNKEMQKVNKLRLDLRNKYFGNFGKDQTEYIPS